MRRVALDSDTTERLAAHRKSVIERAEACDTSLADDGFVFSVDVRTVGGSGTATSRPR